MPYLTPDTIPDDTVCYSVRIPNNRYILAAFMGAVSELSKYWNWELFGEMTPDDMAAEFTSIYQTMAENKGALCMIGSILPFAVSVLPSGVLLCDGTQYLRVDYPDLYAALDSAFIVDADNFITPDLSDRMIYGTGGNAVGTTGGSETVTLTEAQIPSHNHTYNQPNTSLTIGGAGAPIPANVGILPGITGNAGGSGSHNNMPPFMAMKLAIVAL